MAKAFLTALLERQTVRNSLRNAEYSDAQSARVGGGSSEFTSDEGGGACRPHKPRPGRRAVKLIGVLGLGLGGGLIGCDANEGDPFEGLGIVVANSGTPQSRAYASYRRLEARRPRCPGEIDLGQCSFYDCWLPADEEIALAAPGVVTISGASVEVELTPETGYVQALEDMPLFAGGEELTFTVEGGEGIDPHEDNLVAPSPIEVSEPVLSEAIEIDRLVDFPVTWTGGNGDEVQVSLAIEQVVGDEIRRVGLACQYPVLAPRVILPKSLLTSLPPVSDPLEAELTIGAWTSRRGDVPKWLYAFSATAGQSVPVTLR